VARRIHPTHFQPTSPYACPSRFFRNHGRRCGKTLPGNALRKGPLDRLLHYSLKKRALFDMGVMACRLDLPSTQVPPPGSDLSKPAFARWCRHNQRGGSNRPHGTRESGVKPHGIQANTAGGGIPANSANTAFKKYVRSEAGRIAGRSDNHPGEQGCENRP